MEQPFPPPYVAPTPDPTGPQQPLRVLRFQPEGEVPLVPRLSLTFSAPMVAVGSLDDLAQEAVPVRLEPQPPGSWRWIGTQTLVFEPEGERFPMATDYRVSVPEGVRAAGGEALLEGLEFGFSTPPLRLVSGLPSGTAGLEPTIALSFDQRVDAQALAPSLQLLVAGEAVPFRLATAEEAAPLGLDPARSVCLRPTAALPNAVSVQVQVSQGAASAEGPRLSSAAQTHGFRTFGPLEVVRHESGHRGRCPPGSPFRVYFNNSLDTASVTGLLRNDFSRKKIRAMASAGGKAWVRARLNRLKRK